MTLLEKVWYRPALVIFTASAPVSGVTDGTYTIGDPYEDYIVLTDDNRSTLDVNIERIEYKKRMINGRMRSYHVTDKKSFNISWNEIPTASAILSEARQPISGIASGKEMLQWHQSHPDSFWMMLVYDTPNPQKPNDSFQYRVESYNVFFENFDYNVVKRGSSYDHWNVSMSLVEV